jgi:outer membrane protein TolC
MRDPNLALLVGLAIVAGAALAHADDAPKPAAPASSAAPPSSAAPAATVPPAPTLATPTLGAAPPGVERLALAAAVQRALARNVSAQAAIADVRRVEALLREVRASSLPQLAAQGTYTRLDDDRKLGDRVVAAKDQLSANVTLSAPLVAPKAWAQWAHAKDEVDSARASLEDARRAVAVATARAYLAVLSQRRVVEINERARNTARAHLAFSSQREAAGLGNKIDSIRAAQEAATSEAQVETAVAGLVRAREALGVLVGAEAPVEASEGAELATPSALREALEGVEQRADLRAQRARLAAAQHVVRDDWTDYSPYLTGVFQPFYQNPPGLVQPLTGWQAQLILNVPLYDGGLRYGQADERAARRDTARVQLEGALRQARSEVRAAFDAVVHADAALGSARHAADLAHQAFDLADLAYKSGATTNLEVIDAERRSRDAETAAVVAEDAARQARLDLLAASGRFP